MERSLSLRGMISRAYPRGRTAIRHRHKVQEALRESSLADPILPVFQGRLLIGFPLFFTLPTGVLVRIV